MIDRESAVTRRSRHTILDRFRPARRRVMMGARVSAVGSGTGRRWARRPVATRAVAYASIDGHACVLAMGGCGVRGESWRVLAGAQRAAMTAACVRHGVALRHSECEGDWVMMAG